MPQGETRQTRTGVHSFEVCDLTAAQGAGPSRDARLIEILEGLEMEIQRGSPANLEMLTVRIEAFFIARIRGRHVSIGWKRARLSSQRRSVFLLVSGGQLDVLGDQTVFAARGGGISIVFPSSTPISFETPEVVEVLVFSFDKASILADHFVPENVGDVSSASSVFRSVYAFLQATINNHAFIGLDEPPIMSGLLRSAAQALATVSTQSSAQRDTYELAVLGRDVGD